MKYTSEGCVTDIQIAYIGGGSRGWAWTFMNDPLVKGHRPSYEEVCRLVDDMIAATSAYLPEG